MRSQQFRDEDRYILIEVEANEERGVAHRRREWIWSSEMR